MLKGYKTYAIAAGSIVYAAVGFYMGWMDQAHTETLIQTALVAFGLRSAVG